MKYIEDLRLSRLAQELTHEGPECSVHTRIESYSCKNIKRDKKLFKSLEHAYKDDISHSAPPPSWVSLDPDAEMTPFGPFDKHSSRKTLYTLIATLNVAFPDYEFSDVRPYQFSKEKNGASVLNSLSTTLVAPHRAGVTVPRTYSSYPPTSTSFFPSSVPSSSSPYNRPISSPYDAPPIVSGTHPTLYKIIDDTIGLDECEVYSYEPPIESDPHANDFEDEEDDFGLSPDEDSSTDDEDESPFMGFEFDDYDVDEPGRHRRRTSSSETVASSQSNSVPHIPSHSLSKRRGALLWSSHWFFLNRKKKRILFISVWARTRGLGRVVDFVDDDLVYNFGPTSAQKRADERFLGWQGSDGAGARALGLKVASSA